MVYTLFVSYNKGLSYQAIISSSDFDDPLLSKEIQRCRRNRIVYHVEHVKRPVQHGYLSRILELFK